MSLVTTKGRVINFTLLWFQKSATVVLYYSKERKVVTPLSTTHFYPQAENTPGKNPNIIIDYDGTKAGVDTINKLQHKLDHI